MRLPVQLLGNSAECIRSLLSKDLQSSWKVKRKCSAKRCNARYCMQLCAAPEHCSGTPKNDWVIKTIFQSPTSGTSLTKKIRVR